MSERINAIGNANDGTLRTRNNGSPLYFTTQNFVKHINSLPQTFETDQLVEKYFKETLAIGLCQVLMKECGGWCPPGQDNKVVVKHINGTNMGSQNAVALLKKFFEFNNIKYKKMAAEMAINFINKNVLDEYYHDTTPHSRFLGGMGGVVDLQYVKPEAEKICDYFYFMAANPSLFSAEQVQVFISNYIRALHKRTTHPRINHEPYYVPCGLIVNAVQEVRSDDYSPMRGMYVYDMQNLEKMTMFLKSNHLSCHNISSAVQMLPFQFDSSDYDRGRGKGNTPRFVQEKNFEIAKSKLLGHLTLSADVFKENYNTVFSANGDGFAFLLNKYKISTPKQPLICRLKSLFNLKSTEELNKNESQEK